jgi:hypothetical protein
MDENLKVVISAVDDASKALASVKDGLTGLKKGADDASSSLDKNSIAANKGQGAHENLAKGVFTGIAAYDAFRKGLQIATDFLKSSFEESVNAEAAMARVKTNVENAGMSFDALAPKLKEYSTSMIQMGFDDEATSESVSKLMLVTGNYSKAVQLNQLAMDLARNKSISLEDATKSISQVLQGQGARALIQYGLSFKEGASAAEVLNELQEKVKGSAVSFSDTTAGKLAIVSEQWNNMKQEIGDKLAPIALQMFTEFEKHLPEIEALVQGAVTVITKMASAVGYVVKAAEELGSVLGSGLTTEEQDAADATTALKIKMDGLAVAYDKVHKGAKITGDAFMGSQIDMKLLREATKDYQEQTAKSTPVADKLSQSLKGIGADAKQTGDKIIASKDKTKQLTAAFNDMKTSAATDVASMRDSFSEGLKSINDSIAKTQKSIGDLTKAYTKQSSDDVTTVAEQIVESENKIKDIKKQLGDATTDDSRSQLLQQLADEQKNYDSSASFRQDHADAISAAEARASETDLQRAIDDYNARKAIADQEYADKMNDLQNELAAEQLQKTQLISLYTQRLTAINGLIQQATDQYVLQSQTRLSQTQAEVDAEIKLYTNLASAIGSLKSASTSAISTITVVNPTISGKRAGGGPVGRSDTYLVGENGPELFTPDAPGNITKNSDLGGGNLHIHIEGNNFYGTEDMADQVADQVMKELSKRMKL